MTYEEFRKQWFTSYTDTDIEPYLLEVAEYFCQCDYKRCTGEWKSGTL